jgi:hypothetical protein
MKSQLMTALSIVGVLGTATTAMAVNTDVLANVDQVTTGTATDTLLPDPADSNAPASLDAPTATPAPSISTDSSGTPAPTTPNGSSSNTVNNSGTGQSNTSNQAPVAQTPANPVVNGTTGGSGSRVAPATNTSPYVENEEHDEHEDHEEDDEQGEVDDD